MASPTKAGWSPVAETLQAPLKPEPAAATQSDQTGGVLACGGRAAAAGSRTRARIAQNVAEQAAHRVGTLAILTAVTVVGMAILQNVLQPDMAAAQQTPLYRLSALFLVLAAAGVAALQRAGLLSPQQL